MQATWMTQESGLGVCKGTFHACSLRQHSAVQYRCIASVIAVQNWRLRVWQSFFARNGECLTQWLVRPQRIESTWVRFRRSVIFKSVKFSAKIGCCTTKKKVVITHPTTRDILQLPFGSSRDDGSEQQSNQPRLQVKQPQGPSVAQGGPNERT